MDLDFYNDIEASSMSVDEILREFHAQEESAFAAPEPVRRERSAPGSSAGRKKSAGSTASRSRRSAPAPQPPARRREAPRRQARPGPEPRAKEKTAALQDGLARAGETLRSSFSRLSAELTRATAPKAAPKKNNRGRTAETEKAMDYEAEKLHTEASAPVGDDGAFGIPADFFAPEADAAGNDADSPPVAAAEPTDDSLSLEDILNEYGKIFAEKPAEEPAEEPAAEATRYFTPKKEERPPEQKASAEDYAAFAAGSSAVASSREKISALSSMADEAMRYMSSLTDEDYDRMQNAPAPRPAPAKRDAGAERYNLSGHESKMVFGDKELDLSADENYTPPVQKSAPIYHWTAGEEDLPDAPQEAPGLLQRIMSFNGSRRREKKRPLNAPARRARSEYSTTLAPEETAEEEAGAPVSDDTLVFTASAETPHEKRAAPSEADFSFSFDDAEAAPADYAPDAAYAPEEVPAEQQVLPDLSAFTEPEEPGEAIPEARENAGREAAEAGDAEEELGEFPSFTQYVSGLITGALYRLRGGNASGSVTMDTDGEDLGPELTPAAASKHYGSFVPSLRLRFRIGLGLLFVLAWISLGLPVSGMLRTVRVAAAMCLALQLGIMLLSLDVITNAAINMARLRFGADSLAALCCVLTSFDALAVAVDAFGTPHMPLCLLSSLSLMGVLYSSLLAARGLRKSLRVPSIAKRCYSVTGEVGLKGKGLTLLKTDRPITGFVRRTEEAGPDETAFLRASPALLILALLFAVIVSAARRAGGDLLYILTALLTPAVPVCSLLCFALPFFIGANRIFYSGAALAGWSGLSDVGRSQNLIITDRDLFPEGSIEIDTVRIFADAEPEKILSYAGTMILASGSGLAPSFAELMNRNGGTMRHVDNYEQLPGGGMKGIIDGSTVLCGGTELMRLMNVRIPYRLVDKTTVLLAVDGVLYGIFNIKYTGQPQVRKALVGLIRSSRHPVFAIRDFNVNPEMLREIFDVATDGYDFPPYTERFKLSEAPADSQAPVSAVICREGLGPLSLAADTGRSMYLATRFNLILTLLSALLGVFVVFIRFLTVGQVGVPFLLVFLLLWALPVIAVSLFLRF